MSKTEATSLWKLELALDEYFWMKASSFARSQRDSTLMAQILKYVTLQVRDSRPVPMRDRHDLENIHPYGYDAYGPQLDLSMNIRTAVTQRDQDNLAYWHSMGYSFRDVIHNACTNKTLKVMPKLATLQQVKLAYGGYKLLKESRPRVRKQDYLFLLERCAQTEHDYALADWLVVDRMSKTGLQRKIEKAISGLHSLSLIPD